VGARHLPGVWASVIRSRLTALAIGDDQYQLRRQGISATVEVLIQLRKFLDHFNCTANEPYFERLQELENLMKGVDWQLLAGLPGNEMSVAQVARMDFLLRTKLAAEMQRLLAGIYEIDVYIAVSKVAGERNFSYATALFKEVNILSADELTHPGLSGGIGNPVSLHLDQNVLFLTGANMAGKSTYMKAVGIAVYLAHIGFPVAAKGMRFSVRDGLYTSINVSDNLNMGYSHFYAEVLRVKQAAQLVGAGNNLVVIFDELFKGTNVKDAFDATLAVTAAFSRYRNCIFIVSTHIVEVGEELRRYPGVQFGYMPTVMNGNVPQYTYSMEEGISNDRHGMMIVHNEGILQLIRGGILSSVDE
jgi:hypothetical protein